MKGLLRSGLKRTSVWDRNTTEMMCHDSNRVLCSSIPLGPAGGTFLARGNGVSQHFIRLSLWGGGHEPNTLGERLVWSSATRAIGIGSRVGLSADERLVRTVCGVSLVRAGPGFGPTTSVRSGRAARKEEKLPTWTAATGHDHMLKGRLFRNLKTHTFVLFFFKLFLST